MHSSALVIVVGIVFHAVYIWSIFDIYFKSPIIHGMKPVSPLSPPPAQRLVLFVGDGCRADKFFEADDTFLKEGREAFAAAVDGENPTANTPSNLQATRVPFLRHVAMNVGSWGVSHTRVPTESRPGHVALFAGFYEDVSAVTKGWQANPVDFDSIFNHSSHSWLFGSPDIVPMFAENIPHVDEKHYSHMEEDFATEASSLDVWVYKHVEELFQAAKTNSTLDTMLRAPKVVFFFHFLGIDTNGHAYRPNSKEYLSNIALVDRAVQRLSEMIETFYHHDKKTAYIMTADHGMSNKGAHGDGDPTNTRTPLVAWGAGVRGPEPKSIKAVDLNDETRHERVLASSNPSLRQVKEQWDRKSEEDAKDTWKLDGLVRKDIMQADVAPLAASLIGVAIPVNSVGVLPVNYLEPGQYRAEAVSGNAKQILWQAKLKSKMKERHALYFRPFSKLSEMEKLEGAVDKHLKQQEYDLAEEKSHQIIQDGLDALVYFQKYDWGFLMSVITLGYVGWIIILLISLKKETALSINRGIFGSTMCVCVVLFAMEKSPMSYYFYVFFPILFFSIIAGHLKSMLGHGLHGISLSQVILYLIGLELIVVGYIHRQVFSILFVALAVWPWTITQAIKASTPIWNRSRGCWSIGCVSVAIFPLLPSEYGDDLPLVYLGALAFVYGAYMTFQKQSSHIENRGFVLQLALVVASIALVGGTMQYLNNKQKPPMFLPLCSWIVAMGSVPFALWIVPGSSSEPRVRLLSVFAAMCPAYVLLSISYEVLFYTALCATLLLWVRLEELQRSATDRTSDDLRIAFFFLLFIKIAFFGTGNVASMSSFEISSTYRFVTTFSPFTMGALLVLKILIPFTLVTAAFQVVTMTIGKKPFRLFLLVLAMSDVLSINFFFLVRDEGSWKEIGNSISMFGIVNAQIVFIPLMFFVSSLFTRHIQIRQHQD